MAVTAETLLFTQSDIYFSSSSKPSLATPACKECGEPAQFALGCQLFSGKARASMAAIRGLQISSKNGNDRQQRPLNLDRRFQKTDVLITTANRAHHPNGKISSCSLYATYNI